MKKDITKNNFQMSAPSEAHKIVEIYVHSEEDGLIDGAPEWVQDLADKEVS
ncbi:MAG: hypothetical protein SVU88_03435 [Candidatus Nanohaloarchaea archaeon]|nr:hypothetical protein [Candidatus Nanohaloarchaea archaeon]